MAQRNIEYPTLFAPQELHDRMEEGFVIDYESLRDVENTMPNVGSKYVQLIKER